MGAGRRLGIPAASGFHTRFDRYMRDYGAAFLQPVALRWMRHFHNLADATLVPTRELRDFLGQGGFENVKLLPRAVRSEEHTSELQSLMRITYAVFCYIKKISNIYK